MKARGIVRGLLLALGLAAPAALSACDGEPALSGAEEPIRVKNGTFKEGTLPGTPPLAEDAGAPEGVSLVTLIESASSVFRPGQSGKTISGRSTGDATGIAVRFADLGTGYWVVPTDVKDTEAPGELQWSMSVDVAQDIAPGNHTLRFVAIDEQGNAGPQRELTACVPGPIPDNLNACDPTREPPAAVLSLAWDTDADLDLVLIAPDGKVVDSKHPSTAPVVDGGVKPSAEADGIFDRDSNGNCVADRVRRENLIWQSVPASGQYLVYANMFSACGQQSARFVLSLWLAEATGEGENQRLVEKIHIPGELLAIDANGGEQLGLYLTNFVFQ